MLASIEELRVVAEMEVEAEGQKIMNRQFFGFSPQISLDIRGFSSIDFDLIINNLYDLTLC